MVDLPDRHPQDSGCARTAAWTHRRATDLDGRRLPMVRIDKPYAFEGPDGTVGLLDLFEGANQAHVATLLPDGSPHSVPVWVGVEE